MIETAISKTADKHERALAEVCRIEFDRYGHLNGDPRVAGLEPLRCLQVDLIRWQTKNFGVHPSDRSAWGVIEELGEMLDAIADGTTDEVTDAVGDIMVFTVNLCTSMRLDFQCIMSYVTTNMKPASGLDSLMNIWRATGRLAHVMLKSQQCIRGYEDVEVRRRDCCIALARMLENLGSMVYANDESIENILFEVAIKVMQRDWIKYPDTGLPPESMEELKASNPYAHTCETEVTTPGKLTLVQPSDEELEVRAEQARTDDDYERGVQSDSVPETPTSH